MKAMLLKKVVDMDQDPQPLVLSEVPKPEPGEKEILLKLNVCGVCHTEIDEIEGRAMPAFFPIIPGHQGVGRVEKCGSGCTKFKPGDKVGVAWIFSACQKCHFCTSGMENLCENFKASGRDAHGAYAEYMCIREDFAVGIPKKLNDLQAAPLLCAGAIGYRSVRLAAPKDHENIGLMGFGASAHLVIKMLRHLHPSLAIYVFSRTKEEREFARECGASWTGDIDGQPPVKLQSIIDTTPAWKPVLESLKNLQRGGRLVINAIRKENTDRDILTKISYQDHLWLEKEIKTVANITTMDVSEFLQLAVKAGISPTVTEYPLINANEALLEIKQKKIKGAKVLRISNS
ncbi:zinc-dependent alcohol dehydrogenase family protein [Salinimicrobium sp. TH3]|uniref:zinc-dependent alcohol dehydrogenase family protein n=1 Tax=Salinimicrobium sp. TH3 TaxID=2997342 RepID=UPI0022723C5B|nr:zinc-dependent alcohol dehydrogenase family protein [Salinimicrobium sp. TH3]MCY2685882.1 zinc-dependent alcohol dehydrogenase family protein [Salinimicrobium sp. TH3]